MAAWITPSRKAGQSPPIREEAHILAESRLRLAGLIEVIDKDKGVVIH